MRLYHITMRWRKISVSSGQTWGVLQWRGVEIRLVVEPDPLNGTFVRVPPELGHFRASVADQIVNLLGDSGIEIGKFSVARDEAWFPVETIASIPDRVVTFKSVEIVTPSQRIAKLAKRLLLTELARSHGNERATSSVRSSQGKRRKAPLVPKGSRPRTAKRNSTGSSVRALSRTS